MAEISVPKPHQIGDLGQQGERRKLYTYLYQLSEKLESAMQNIGSENMSDAYNKQMTDITSVSDKAKQLAAMLDNNELAKTKNVRENFKELSDSISTTAQNVTASFDSAIEQTDKSIKDYVAAHYYASEEDMTLAKKISTTVEQQASSWEVRIATLEELDVGAVTQLTQDFETYIRFTSDGLTLGKQGGSAIEAKLTNKSLDFVQAGTTDVLASISNDKLHINIAEIDRLSLGNEAHGYLDVDMEADGLFVRWGS